MDFNDFNLGELFKSASHQLYKRYPSFDKYPKYMQDALVTNERMQERMPKDK